jgi:glycosyltransferase involved in cell wall biosynthesis
MKFEKRPLLSVVMPVRGAEETLGEAVESCLGQDFEDFELLLVDDGMTPATREYLTDVGARDGRLRVVERGQGGGGLVEDLNAGVAAACGELIGRMDADDVNLPERFGRQVGWMRERVGIGVLGCGVKVTGDKRGDAIGEGFREYEGWINALTSPEEIAAQRFVESPIVHPSVVMRREAIEAVGGYRDAGWAEDYDLWLRMMEAGWAFAKLDEVLMEWRDSPGRLTRSDGRYSQENFFRAKAHFLGRMGAVKEKGVSICGAGPIGKRMATLIREEGVEVEAYYEVHPRRIGERIGGIPVISSEELAGPGGPVLLSAVGLRGGRGRVRALAVEAGYVEGEDFFCVA